MEREEKITAWDKGAAAQLPLGSEWERYTQRVRDGENARARGLDKYLEGSGSANLRPSPHNQPNPKTNGRHPTTMPPTGLSCLPLARHTPPRLHWPTGPSCLQLAFLVISHHHPWRYLSQKQASSSQNKANLAQGLDLTQDLAFNRIRPSTGLRPNRHQLV